MKWGDLIWTGLLVILLAPLIDPQVRTWFTHLVEQHPYTLAFIKFFIFASMGELLAIRIVSRSWTPPPLFAERSLVWGFLGVVICLIFGIYSYAIVDLQQHHLLPSFGNPLMFALEVSIIMNLTFAPTMMGFHRVTDRYLDMRASTPKGTSIAFRDVVNHVDWDGFVRIVVVRTIPLFWIPVHTATFLLPSQYRVLMAAVLSIALGGILAFAKRIRHNPSNSHI